MGYRPIKVTGWRDRDSTVEQLIEIVEKRLYDFAQTDSFDSGRRLSEVEAYLQGLKDARMLIKRTSPKH